MFSGPKLLITLLTVGAAVIYFLIASGKLVRFLEKAKKEKQTSASPEDQTAIAELVKCPACGEHTVMPCSCGGSSRSAT